MRENQLIETFVGGALSDVVKAELVRGRAFAEAFDEVRGNARRCTTELGSKREEFVLGKTLGGAIERQGEGVGLLPDDHIEKRLGFVCHARYSLPATHYRSSLTRTASGRAGRFDKNSGCHRCHRGASRDARGPCRTRSRSRLRDRSRRLRRPWDRPCRSRRFRSTV